MNPSSTESTPDDPAFFDALGRLVDRYRSRGSVDFQSLERDYSEEWVARLKIAFRREIAEQATLEKGQDVASADRIGPQFPPPEVKGFRILRYLDRGGCAEVWLARAEVGFVVMKAVSGRVEAAELQGLRVFKRLADDPLMGLVPVQFIGRCESTGRLCYTMPPADSLHGRGLTPEDYEPCTLSAWIRSRGGLSRQETLGVAHEVLTSLARIHRKGIVHRDLKPKNLLRLHDRWKIGDMGLLVKEDRIDESPAAGTPHYMPLRRGEDGRELDLYAVGKTIYEMLVGNPKHFPSRKAEHQSEDQKADYEPLYEIVEKACSEDPKERYASAEAFLRDLPVEAKRTEARDARARWKWRFFGTVVLLAAVSVVALQRWQSPEDFSLRTEFLRVDEVGNERPIYEGDQVPNGSRVSLRYQADAPAYVYVWCESTSSRGEESYGLFPSETLSLKNPISGGEEVDLPGWVDDTRNTWVLDEEEGSQQYHVHVSLEPVPELGEKIRAMTQLKGGERELTRAARSLAQTTKALEETRGLAGLAPAEFKDGERPEEWTRVRKSVDGFLHYVLRFEQVEVVAP